MAHPNTHEMDLPRAPPGRISGHSLSMPVSYARDDAAVAKTASADISLEQRELSLLGPVYLIERDTGGRGFIRKRINDAEQLRVTIDSRTRDDRLYVFQGLSADYLKILRDELDVAARFLEAHAGRRAYRPLMRRSRETAGIMDGGSLDKSGFACFEYPELVTSIKRTVATGHSQASSADILRTDDVVNEVPTYAMSNDGDYVMFCRASLWLGAKAEVLLLDRPIWSRPSSEFRKAAYPSSGPVHNSLIPFAGKEKGSSVGSETLYSEHTNGDKDDIPSLETLVYQSLVEEAQEREDNAYLIEDIAIHQWIEFFEALSADITPNPVEMAALYKQVQKSLERNLSQSQFRDKVPDNGWRYSSSTTPTWESLLSRLTRHLSLLNYLNPPPPTTITTTTTQPVPSSPTPSSSASHTHPNPRAQLAINALPPQTSHRSPTSSDEQNQQSLDRVSYMGGVLLPLSIVSSILSMSDPFGPGGSQFFVFWAVSIPLVFITILIIYADSIRKAEVWIEVASNSSTVGSEKHGEEEEEGKQEEGISMPEFDGGAGRRRMRVRMGPGMGECESDDGYGMDEWDEVPGMMVERVFKNAGKKKWRREQLGWMGACKAVFRIYKLKKGRPPNWQTNVRRGNTV
ncbi:hypothetical protein F4805DRAFT_246293 [Annulohypoxylon moriforme]|nr:hypothetical protein F4805DRAFT_246293 [Annulohypoxylon moriforme]